ncbi:MULTISPECIES: flagellar hook-associated protein FlgK [Achromobacter]|uniref:Flagellar hook-associated protein 1 n=1 Tax=Alcaligenes xylosoxydans xylosoxydans TaxID=85698 RepID=A0A424W605_ALCXX|nr:MULTISPECIES: flagellar hook-associated protein FlgK [Achromobacter]MBC9908374.1 flagellar hook-associated protein FlgK [Achromobacter xylosoxidans]MBD0872144.1 flagellar hook-associated protein FlgK [Achromobacter xylosoxidans]MDH1304369.1 flagellar hook-associated protein FlgK [Achromobacter sp. GD03932]QNP83506.1 flagellar hook-associated protein FlgK [Achromobacter xylosoxidans]RPJ88756.1 flagellar hook-associated protein FlgK [Achromobacter xylosoxidans]
MNMYKLALGGLNAAQAGLATTSHNINNATTAGYNRQRVMVSTAGAQATSNGFIGRGVQVDTVVRSYDSFLYKQLVGAQGSGAQLQTQFDQVSQINNLFADRTVGIAPGLTNFFTSMNTVASKPADPAARQDLLGKANSLATQIRSAYSEMQNQRMGLNAQITTTVDQVNSYLSRIDDLNQQISLATGKAGGSPPNDLLDQRDQAVMELNQLVGVTTYEQGDKISISLANGGQALLSGNTIYPLQAVSSSQDTSRTVIAYTLPAGAGKTVAVELNDAEVTGGKLGGLLQFRASSLDVMQSQLGQMAVGLALSFNEQHKQGLDQSGKPGTDFFGISNPQGVPNANNKGNAQISGQFTDLNNINAKDYEISFDGSSYRVLRMPEGTQVYNGPATGTPPSATLDLRSEMGVTLTIDAPPQAGDKWSLSPTRDAARDLQVLITDPDKIAAADAAGGDSNGKNALKLAQLQTAKVLGRGTMNITEMFSQVVNTVGVQTAQIKTAAIAQGNLIAQKTAAQQAVSGVNLNEEYVSLSLYQEQYQASARIIDVASTMFDTLLGLRG